LKIALGTVQFGLRYGIANQNGQVSKEDARAILAHARAEGMDVLDTAIAYGESERTLGELNVADWKVVSKLPEIPVSCRDVGAWVAEEVAGSLDRLRVSRLYGLLLHRPAQLLDPVGPQLYEALERLKRQKTVAKIGVSVYAPAELDAIMRAHDLDLVQAPLNIVDRRLITSGWLDRLRERGVELHVRSIFLQGLLVMDRKSRPRQFDRWKGLWAAYDAWLDDTGLTALEACVRFALSFPSISRVIAGVDTVEQLDAILHAAGGTLPAVPLSLQSTDEDLVNPAKWPRS
jgi:aryl-alcohol dehydrogenase-like predicted oxidoreductase